MIYIIGVCFLSPYFCTENVERGVCRQCVSKKTGKKRKKVPEKFARFKKRCYLCNALEN